MLRRTTKGPVFWLGIGLSMGLMLTAGVVIGTKMNRSTQPELQLPITALNATATHGSENFAVATGLVKDGTEGVFFLDSITGDIQCQVINRRTLALAGQFRHNVFNDLGVEQGKKPRLLMVTGAATFPGGAQLADTLVYVVDANSGRFVAYALPFARNIMSSNRTQFETFRLVGKGSVREQGVLRD